MNRFIVNKSYLLSLFLVVILLSCKGIASLPVEPVLLEKNDPVSLAIDEAALFQYALSLNLWLLDTKEYVDRYYKRDKFPYFEPFDPTYQGDAGELGITKRIAYYKRYIEGTKPIAVSVYRKYTQVYLEE
ncbi:BBA14 family lipoprotein [Borrelia hispanica]|uniref:BBA14 family lipoprotein n=1 Tax=Borrelia hispanica TaxID=40835 RepID=UPI000465F083|nr:BBA14 family lipoprotein [Borrelia hispanica]